MSDRYDFASAIKAVDRKMPEEAKLIREYIEKLKIKENIKPDPTEETETYIQGTVERCPHGNRWPDLCGDCRREAFWNYGRSPRA